ncbi:MAG: hypothetical protein OXD01_06720 [Gammaproteobacteria bacterium]|nr:hypothetical protein [Gammaproteobacteria bacterium]
MAYNTLRGTIRYTSKKPERLDQERGREFFTLSLQPDGTDVLHAHCEIDDEPMVVRDVVASLDHQTSAPRDCSVRLSVGHRFEGSGWFRFNQNFVECETINHRDGRISQRIDIDQPVRWMQCHPIVGDALLMKLYDLSQGPGKSFFDNIMLSSPDHRGATGPMLFPLGFGIRYVGEETVQVEAGTFDTRHFQVVDTAGQLPEEHPPYNVWCTADDNYILVKAGAEGYMQTHYELTELATVAGE